MWHRGTLDIGDFRHDAAVFEGHRYSAFPPLFTIICYVVTGAAKLLGGEYVFPDWAYRLILGPPLLVLCFWAARTCAGAGWKAGVLTIALLLGTAAFPMLIFCRVGGFFEINHVLACCGLLLIAGDAFGKRRVWPALIGLSIGFLTRQLTVLYVGVVAWMIWQLPAPRRTRWIAAACATLVVVVGFYCSLNTAKFGSPLDSGYRYMYEGRKDMLAVRAQRGLFHVSFIPDNLRYMMFEPPGLSVTAEGLKKKTDQMGAGIWLTSPLLVFVLLTARQWWRDPARRAAMLCSFAVVAILMTYHNTGWRQPGFNRFSLDFVPIWLMVIAPYLWGRWQTPLTIAFVAWSVWYYRFVTFNNLAWFGLTDG